MNIFCLLQAELFTQQTVLSKTLGGFDIFFNKIKSYTIAQQ